LPAQLVVQSFFAQSPSHCVKWRCLRQTCLHLCPPGGPQVIWVLCEPDSCSRIDPSGFSPPSLSHSPRFLARETRQFHGPRPDAYLAVPSCALTSRPSALGFCCWSIAATVYLKIDSCDSALPPLRGLSVVQWLFNLLPPLLMKVQPISYSDSSSRRLFQISRSAVGTGAPVG